MILNVYALHHICILTMFHHYRCVLDMLKSCVLVGLDWAEPMMFLLLHITCSCIFHAFIPSFLYILLLICVGTFMFLSLSLSLSLTLSLSLSLSLSLYALACSIAPKRKSAPSRNPLRFGASSSNPTPSHDRFHDEKAHSDFSENFSRQGIHSERHVILLDFSNTDLPTIIYSRG